MIHRLLYGHWALWERCRYDFLTWSYCCLRCRHG
jgi:hypothetical protein